MKKTVLTSFTILVLLSIVFLMGFQIPVRASPNLPVHNTDTGLDYATIQEAINASETLDGHTILVEGGIYYEQVVLNKSLTLEGEDKETTIVDGNGTDVAILVAKHNVTITGLTVQNASYGITVDKTEHCRISENIVYNNTASGIRMIGGGRHIVQRNTITKSETGITGYLHADRCTIQDNTITENSHGIDLYSSQSISIERNNITSNNRRVGYSAYGDGIVLHHVNGCRIVDNNISSNVHTGVILNDVDNGEISGNSIIDGGEGIDLVGHNLTIMNNDFMNNLYEGILVGAGSESIVVYHNNFINNTDNVWADFSGYDQWDNGDEGNFWDDYDGYDSDRDGIGDEPYVIDWSDQDNYPLMGVFSQFDLTSEHQVQIISNSAISDFRLRSTETGDKAMIFTVTGEDSTVGFCRTMIPKGLMNYSYIVLVDGEEIIPTLLDTSNEVNAYLFFTYNHSSHTVTITSSKLLYLYNQLVDEYTKLLTEFNSLNSTMTGLSGNVTILQEQYDSLQTIINDMQDQVDSLNSTYQTSIEDLHGTIDLLNSTLTRQEDFISQLSLIRDMMYIFVGTTILFIVTTIYFAIRKPKIKP